MTSSTKLQSKQRYRLYFPLMDLCLIFGIIGLGEFILEDALQTTLVPMDQWWGLTIGLVVIFFNAILTPFLIVARFLRDEYSEQLWRRTSIVLVYFVSIAPLVLWISDWIAFFTINSEHPRGPFAVIFQETTWSDAMFYTWMIFGVLFVAIFELLRFRDSRS